VPAIKATLPPEVVKIIDDFELYGRGSPDEYNRASMVYLERYYCLAHPFPPPMEHIMDNFNPQIMSTMWGGDLNVTGNLKNFDVTKKNWAIFGCLYSCIAAGMIFQGLRNLSITIHSFRLRRPISLKIQPTWQ